MNFSEKTILIGFLFSFFALANCTDSDSTLHCRDINFVEFYRPAVCKGSENCSVKYFYTEQVSNRADEKISHYLFDEEKAADYTTISTGREGVTVRIAEIRKHLLKNKSIYLQTDSLTHHYEILNGDVYACNNNEVSMNQIMKLNHHGLHLTTTSTSVYFDSVSYQNKLHNAFIIEGTIEAKTQASDLNIRVKETHIGGLGIIERIQKMKGDTIFHQVLDSVKLINSGKEYTFQASTVVDELMQSRSDS